MSSELSWLLGEGRFLDLYMIPEFKSREGLGLTCSLEVCHATTG